MNSRYVYADLTDHGMQDTTDHHDLAELTPTQAAERYDLRADGAGFSIVLLEGEQQHPRAIVEVDPHAREVAMKKLNAHGSVMAAYIWTAVDSDKLFLDELIWYAYPGSQRFFCPTESVGTVKMEFRPDGSATRDRVSAHALSGAVESHEYRGLDVSANWTPVPEFGHWEAFFHPEPML